MIKRVYQNVFICSRVLTPDFAILKNKFKANFSSDLCLYFFNDEILKDLLDESPILIKNKNPL